MDFNEIPLILKRYSFTSKMQTSMNFSKKIIDINGIIDADKLVNNFLPWELEIFTLFSTIFEGEYSTRRLDDLKNQKKFYEIMDAIRHYNIPVLENSTENNTFGEKFLIVTGLSQFHLQENIYYRYYRYKYFYTFSNGNIDMEKEFREKFGADPIEFIRFGYIMNFIIYIFGSEVNDNGILLYVLNKYNKITRKLSTTREEQIKKHSKVIKSLDLIDEYVYCFKCFYQFPFVVEDNFINIPLPHVLISSTTTSLLYRITEERDDLREKFGKDILENYVKHIMSLCKYIDELYVEYEFALGNKTVDIMCRKNKSCIMIDCKAFAPRIALRRLTQREIDHSLDRLVSAVIQVYKHITKKFPSKYNPFSIEDFDKEDIFGIVLILEDNYIIRNKIYKRVAEILEISLASSEYQYICSNIKIVNLYSLEEIVFGSHDIFSLLESSRNNKTKWFDYTMIDPAISNKKVIDEIKNASMEIKQVYRDLINELSNEGYLSRSENSWFR